MTEFVPDYFEEFHCIASACCHSCCVGWEIDIDDDTAEYYAALPGPIGDRLRENIISDDTSCFRLDAEERCPFLNRDGLCDLILTLGEESLCEICTEHPRFHNFYGDRMESGLGICCEAAAALIMGRDLPFTLIARGELPENTARFTLRRRVFETLTDRSKPLKKRIAEVTEICGVHTSGRNPVEWVHFCLSLEQLDPTWTAELQNLEKQYHEINFRAYAAFAADCETEYEQLLCYFVYRHFLSMADAAGPGPALGFSLLSCSVIFALHAMRFHNNGSIDFLERVDIARRWSAEIEYSDENPELILAKLERCGL